MTDVLSPAQRLSDLVWTSVIRIIFFVLLFAAIGNSLPFWRVLCVSAVVSLFIRHAEMRAKK